MKDPGTGQGGYSSSAWLYKWVCHSDHPCPVCEAMDGDVRSLDEWRMSRQPGFHKHCQCTLEPVANPAYEDVERSRVVLYPEKRLIAHWNTSAAKQIISGDDIAVPTPKIIRPRLPDSKWKQLE